MVVERAENARSTCLIRFKLGVLEHVVQKRDDGHMAQTVLPEGMYHTRGRYRLSLIQS